MNQLLKARRCDWQLDRQTKGAEKGLFAVVAALAFINLTDCNKNTKKINEQKLEKKTIKKAVSVVLSTKCKYNKFPQYVSFLIYFQLFDQRQREKRNIDIEQTDLCNLSLS